MIRSNEYALLKTVLCAVIEREEGFIFVGLEKCVKVPEVNGIHCTIASTFLSVTSLFKYQLKNEELSNHLKKVELNIFAIFDTLESL